MKAVIDGDFYLYSAGFATEGEPPSHSCQALRTQITNIVKHLGVSEFQIYVSGKGNFREELATVQEYKGNREGRKPTNYPDMKSFIMHSMGATPVDGMEADDQVSILLWEDFVRCGGDKDRAEVILVSVDKDLNNTPGWHYNSGKEKLYWVDPRQAGRHFAYQLLRGDPTDHIPGLPMASEWMKTEYGIGNHKGFGEGSAKKVLSASLSAEQALCDAITCYISWGVERGYDPKEIYDYINEQGKLLWMVRELDDFGSPVIWNLDEEEYERLYERYIREEREDCFIGGEAVLSVGGGGSVSSAGVGGSGSIPQGDRGSDDGLLQQPDTDNDPDGPSDRAETDIERWARDAEPHVTDSECDGTGDVLHGGS